MLPNVWISYCETLREILLCFIQHINRSCHFKWNDVPQAHCYSMGVKHSINIILVTCFREACHTNNLPLPKLYLKLWLNREKNLPSNACLCSSVEITAFQSVKFIYQSGRYLPLKQNSFFLFLFFFLNKEVGVELLLFR